MGWRKPAWHIQLEACLFRAVCAVNNHCFGVRRSDDNSCANHYRCADYNTRPNHNDRGPNDDSGPDHNDNLWPLHRGLLVHLNL